MGNTPSSTSAFRIKIEEYEVLIKKLNQIILDVSSTKSTSQTEQDVNHARFFDDSGKTYREHCKYILTIHANMSVLCNIDLHNIVERMKDPAVKELIKSMQNEQELKASQNQILAYFNHSVFQAINAEFRLLTDQIIPLAVEKAKNLSDTFEKSLNTEAIKRFMMDT